MTQFITLNELQQIGVRVALYTGIGYLAIRGIRTVITHTSRLFGLNDHSNS